MSKKMNPSQRKGKQMQKIAALERHKEALEMRAKGSTYQEIADALGYRTRSGAHYAVQQYIDKYIPKDTIETARLLELERLDALFELAYQRVIETNGSPSAIQACLAIMQRRSKYLGLDEPIKFEPLIQLEYVNDWRTANQPELQALEPENDEVVEGEYEEIDVEFVDLGDE